MMKFASETDFVQFLIERADHSPNVIVGMGVHSPTDCDGFVSRGRGDNFVTGYFYSAEKGFYDHFMIRTNWLNAEDGESTIKAIRSVTNHFYYH